MSVTCRIIRDDEKEFYIDNKVWKITSDGLEGWDYIAPELGTTANAFGDGSYIASERIPEQDRTVTAVLLDRSQNSVMREAVRAFFGVKRTFKVYLSYLGTTKWCEGKLTAYSLPTGNIYDHLTLTFTIKCPQPYLLSVDEFGKNIANVIPRFGFPYVSLVNRGFIFGKHEFERKVILNNKGDVETYAKFVIKAKGDVTNPIIRKDDKFIKVLDEMVEGDVIVIDLVSNPPTVKKNGVNIIGKTDRESSFEGMKFNTGINTLSYDADYGNNLLDITIYYNQRYGGM